MTQMVLDLNPIQEVRHETGDTIDSKFRRFHEQNPHVYNILVLLARQLVANGAKKIGIGMLWEVMRWQYLADTRSTDGYKLNNIYRSRYARMIMDQESDLSGIFEVRELKAE